MTTVKSAISVITLLTLSGCASFDMGMLNPFSSDEEELPEQRTLANTPQAPRASEEDIQEMHKQWGEFQSDLTKITMLESEVAKLKQKVEMQNNQLKTISTMAMASQQAHKNNAKQMKTRSVPSSSGNYSIQIAAASNMEAAAQAWRAQLRKYPDFLSRYSPQYSNLKSGSKEFFRVKVGSFNTNSQALSSCRNFQSIGGQCMVRKN